jgi:hypothetical protein
MRRVKITLLHYAISWGYLTDGIVGILTLGKWHPGLALKLARVYSAAKYRYK